MRFRTGVAALAVILGICASARSRCGLAHQGPRERRGRAPEPAHRLRPGRRPQRHRRHAQQHPLHQAVAASDAGAARRQHPRPDAAHRQRRRRDGDRQPAGLRHAGHPHRRHRLGARRLPRACRAARCWSRRCSAPTATSMRSAQGSVAIGGFQAEGDAAKITRGVPTVGRISNGAIIEREIEFALNRLEPGAARAAQSRLHHRQAHRRGDQRFHRHADRRAARSVDRAAQRPEEISTATWSRC